MQIFPWEQMSITYPKQRKRDKAHTGACRRIPFVRHQVTSNVPKIVLFLQNLLFALIIINVKTFWEVPIVQFLVPSEIYNSSN